MVDVATNTYPVRPLEGTESQLGESPFWHPTEKTLYWVDIPSCSVRSLSFKTGAHQQWLMPSEPGCVVPCRSGNLLVPCRDQIYQLNPSNGELTALLAAPYDTSHFRFNDGRCDALGRLWVGNLFAPKTAELASLYVFEKTDSGYRIQTAFEGNITANGLAFSPDSTTAYWAHTAAHRIDRFSFDLKQGSVANRSAWAQFKKMDEAPVYEGRPDGACVDLEGNYWVAMYEGWQVLKLSPHGKVLQRVQLPVPCVTMPCFGGEGLQTLFITTAKKAMGEQLLHPDAGKIFTTRVDVPGCPVEFFAD